MHDVFMYKGQLLLGNAMHDVFMYKGWARNPALALRPSMIYMPCMIRIPGSVHVRKNRGAIRCIVASTHATVLSYCRSLLWGYIWKYVRASGGVSDDRALMN
jgi:mannitol-specific phosphotransferase system IIBC component